MLNVGSFGAIGTLLKTTGSIPAKTDRLTVASAKGWKEGAGVGVILGKKSFRARVSAIHKRVLILSSLSGGKFFAPFGVRSGVIVNDDSIPIQQALDDASLTGGDTVYIEKGTYRLGVRFAPDNHPLFVSSGTRIIGDGKSNTILQLSEDSYMLWPGEGSEDESPCMNWGAGPVFMNRHNPWWFNPYGPDPSMLPYDENIEIGNLTCDGDKNHQPRLYEPRYRPHPTVMPAPQTTISWVGVAGAGTLPQGIYEAWICFQDADGNEGPGAWQGSTPIGEDNDTIQISLPPIYPPGAVAVVPYIRRADGGQINSETNEVDVCGNSRFERKEPIKLTDIAPWDGDPRRDHWPSIQLLSHTYFPQGSIGTQGNFRFPGRVIFNGDASASSSCYLWNVNNLYVHDVELRNFAGDGFMIGDVRNAKFDRLHVHHNGRWGVTVTANRIEEVDFSDCLIELNDGLAVDLEPAGGSGLRWNRCAFRNNPAGISIGAVGRSACRDLEFNDCLFDGNASYQLVTVNSETDIINLKIRDCRFRNNDYECVRIFSGDSQVITGEISGCEFDESNGHNLEYPPRYHVGAGDVSMIVINGVGAKFRIMNNHFKPWAAQPLTLPDGTVIPYYSSSYAIELNKSTGHTIQNNHFESNPLDTRRDIRLGEAMSTNVKNKNFLYFERIADLKSCKIAGNIGDGRIWTNGFGCGIELIEKGSVTSVDSDAMSAIVMFENSLVDDEYLVKVAFRWNAGSWWLTDVTTTGFTINWTQPPGILTISQLDWSASYGT